MYATILANIINVVLNYMFIFGKFGAPAMGVVGAAVGTLVSRVVMVIYLWFLLYSKEQSKAFVTHIKLFTLSKKMLSKVFNLGFPSALQMFFEVAIFTAAIWLSGVLGKNPQAANQIALNLSSMTFMVGIGLSVAAMVRVGNQKGLLDFVSLRRIAYSILFLTLLIEIVFASFFLIFREWLPTLYLNNNVLMNINDNSEVVLIASKLLLVAAFFQIFDGLQVVILGALRGLQDVKIPALITFVSYWIIGFPVSYYLGLYTSFESTGIWIGLFIGLFSASILLYLRFNYLTKKLITNNN